jgi:hypothetical protein
MDRGMSGERVTQKSRPSCEQRKARQRFGILDIEKKLGKATLKKTYVHRTKVCTEVVIKRVWH